jgi:hypothetical protein
MSRFRFKGSFEINLHCTPKSDEFTLASVSDVGIQEHAPTESPTCTAILTFLKQIGVSNWQKVEYANYLSNYWFSFN